MILTTHSEQGLAPDLVDDTNADDIYLGFFKYSAGANPAHCLIKRITKETIDGKVITKVRYPYGRFEWAYSWASRKTISDWRYRDFPKEPPVPIVHELVLTWDNIINVPVADASNVANWNTLFNLPVAGIPFASVSVSGNTVNLFGGSNIILKDYLFNYNINLVAITDRTGCIIEAGTRCFRGCTGLVATSFPALILAGPDCFRVCTGLINPSFPALTSAGTNCFQGCTGLVTPLFPSLTLAGVSCFADCLNLVTPSFPALISANVRCFFGCSSLVNPSFPALTSAGDTCFQTCSNLVNPSFPSLISISQSCFVDCTSLTTASLPLVTTIGDNCFYGCISLINIYIPKVVTLGLTVLKDYLFEFISGKTITLTIPSALMTCNGGAPDGDIQSLQINNTVTIITV